jgi:hypothetical protein
MAKIKKGTYRFNDVLIPPSGDNAYMEQDILFDVVTTAPEFGNMTLQVSCHYISVGGMQDYPSDTAMKYYITSITPDLGETPEYVWVSEVGGWYDKYYGAGIQYVTIPYDQDVSDEFGVWFTANTKEQKQISGKWTFKDVLTQSVGGYLFNGNFKVTTTLNIPPIPEYAFEGYIGEHTFECTKLYQEWHDDVDVGDANGCAVSYRLLNAVPTLPQSLTNLGIILPFEPYVYSRTTGWDAMYGEGIKTIDFGDVPQWVSVDYFDWHINNTERSGIRNLAIMGQLIDKANAVTGKADATLADGVASLCEGYGQDGVSNAVLYVAQELTEEQKAQARANIGAVDTAYIISVFEELKAILEEESDVEDAIAVLDEAILDLSTLA